MSIITQENLQSANARLEQLYKEYHPLLVYYLSSLGYRFQDAEDLAQDTWIKLHKELELNNYQAATFAWLKQVASNAGSDMRKRRNRERNYDTIENTERFDNKFNEKWFREMNQQDMKERITQCKDKCEIDFHEWNLYSLRFEHQENFETIAAILQRSMPTIYRQSLKTMLKIWKCTFPATRGSHENY